MTDSITPSRRLFLGGVAALALAGCGEGVGRTRDDTSGADAASEGGSTVSVAETRDWNLSEAQWRERLTPEQFHVLRKEGTERAGTSPLDAEYRTGTFHCAGCDLPLFTSDMKFDSGTGWPSFFDTIEGAVETRRDFKLILPRTEYHCARCGGHQGHVFKDGPPPTGLRYCNNGVALRFVAADEATG
ncbi:peptide-methionine (R)-S-oxide reductase MsrB [Salinarimonas rosea]|uniref:peptide-methionine (R)-S-oxide reductase MsrB n=1 Tax=Salinarimonas rosea TaxID=552063 RepID=UPI000A024FF2|nr:peptide-methionine (R)-S-oxide reductase MsrB [Salinarimonas rosea]